MYMCIDNHSVILTTCRSRKTFALTNQQQNPQFIRQLSFGLTYKSCIANKIDTLNSGKIVWSLSFGHR